MDSMNMMDDEERRASDLAAYHKVKQIERATPMEDGSLSVYLISGKWINQWRAWINKSRPSPGPVSNRELAERIAQLRLDSGFKIHDNDLLLKENEDHYVLAEDFWNMFSERYGVDVVIQKRKYTEIKDLLPHQIQIGKEFSCFEVDKSMYYDIYREQFEGLTVKARLEKEGQIMERI